MEAKFDNREFSQEEKTEENENRGEERGRQNILSVFDENPEIADSEKLPISESLKVLRYRTLKKNVSLGWWSAVVLLEDHKKKQICYYRWKKKNNRWSRDKKLPIRSCKDWQTLKEAVESFLKELE